VYSALRACLALSAVAVLLVYLEHGGALPIVGSIRPGGNADSMGFVPLSSAEQLGLSSYDAPEIGKEAPGFSLTNLAGEAVNLSDFDDKVVVINFWASWCTACRQDLPVLEDAYREFGGSGLMVVAINYEEPRSTATAFASRLNLDFPVLLDRDGRVAARYRVLGLPVTFIIAPGSSVAARIFGQLSSQTLLDALRASGFNPQTKSTGTQGGKDD
jgi:peroxiredoxin